MNINFFILSGGYGLRARPLSLIRPKPAFPLINSPLINIILEQIKNFGFRSGYINLHYLPDTLRNRIRTDLNIDYIHEEILSGSAVLNRVSNSNSQYTLIVNGDTFLDIPIQELFDELSKSNADGILLTRYDLEPLYPKLIIKNSRFQGKSDQSKAGQMYTGVAIFKTAILKHFKETSFFTSLSKNNFDIRTLEYKGLWLDMGTPKHYYDSVFKHMLHSGEKYSNLIPESAKLSENTTVSKSILWENVQISGESNISNSIILDNVEIDNLSITGKIAFLKNNKLTLIDL